MASATIHEVQSKRHGLIFRIRYDYVDPGSGERRRPWQTMEPGATRRQTEAMARAGVVAIESGRIAIAADLTVAGLLEDWLEVDVRGRKAATTTAGYEDTVRVHLIPALGHLALRKLTPAVVQRWEVGYRKSHGYRTVQLCHTRLKQACAYGVRMNLLASNPLATVRPPATEAKPRSAWTSEEAARFLTVAEECTYYPLWHFLLGTGCRRGEALGLRWCDIDWQAGTARIVQTIRPLRGKIITKKPKNPQSARVVPLHRGLLTRLRAHQVQQAKHRDRMGDAWQDHNLVFASAAGTPINPTNIRRAFILLVPRAEVRTITVHQLRHSAASLALEAGASLEEIRQLLGHKKISTTADIYAAVGERAMQHVAEALRRATGQ